MAEKLKSSMLLNIARKIASRESGFLFAALGVIVQAFHTYYITEDLSSLSGGFKTLQAILMALFISCALLYFTLKSSDEDNPRAKKYRKMVMYFAVIETFINLYYWGNHCLIEQWPTPDYGAFIIAIPFSILLPFTLKSYGGEVRVDEPDNVQLTDELCDDIISSIDNELELQQRIKNEINSYLSTTEMTTNINEDQFYNLFTAAIASNDFKTIIENISSEYRDEQLIDNLPTRNPLPILFNDLDLEPVKHDNPDEMFKVVYMDPVKDESEIQNNITDESDIMDNDTPTELVGVPTEISAYSNNEIETHINNEKESIVDMIEKFESITPESTIELNPDVPYDNIHGEDAPIGNELNTLAGLSPEDIKMFEKQNESLGDEPGELGENVISNIDELNNLLDEQITPKPIMEVKEVFHNPETAPLGKKILNEFAVSEPLATPVTVNGEFNTIPSHKSHKTAAEIDEIFNDLN